MNQKYAEAVIIYGEVAIIDVLLGLKCSGDKKFIQKIYYSPVHHSQKP